MTIAYALDFHPTGTTKSMEVFLLRLTRKLAETGRRSAFIFCAEPADAFALELRMLDAVWRVGRFQPTSAEASRWGRWLRPHRPAVLLTSFMSKFDRSLGVLKRTSGSRYWVCCDQTSGAVNCGGPLKRALAVLRGRWVSRRMDRLVCVSEFVRRRDVEQLHLNVPAVVIPNGIDLDRFVAPGPEPPPNSVAFVGQLTEAKGVHTLLKAAALLSGVRIRIAGAGPLEPEVRACPQVEFVGRIDWVSRLFAESAIAVVPSEWEEAFGFVAAEAMACGCAVVASDAGALPEVVGDAGMVFRRGDPQALAASIRRLASAPDDLSRRRAASVRRAAEFSVDRMVDGYLGVISGLCGPAPTSPRRSQTPPVARPGQ
jgi:glycosyltransferase involved in cell wall biosynthesis